ncbi:MAG: AAA family ATPase [Bdellovibrio sp.]
MINFKVFPAWLTPNGQKVPLISDWQKLATADQTQIEKWKQQFGNRITLWGIPCGSTNNIVTLDVDIKSKVNGWQTLKEKNFEIPRTLSQKTLSGGAHFLFKFNPERPLKNRVGFLPGLDIRSTGGWIAYYGMDFSIPIVDAPEWLYETASVKEEKNTTTADPSQTFRMAPEIAQGILNNCLEEIKNAAAGESNNTLNVESFKVGQLVLSGAFTRDFAEAELMKAARIRGKPEYEAHATIKSGLDGGMKNPLTSPFPNSAPVAAFPIPQAPPPPERWTPRKFTRSDLLNTSKLRKPQLFQDWSSEDITIMTADGGTGKTTLALNESIALALGDRFLGFDCKQTGKTLFITGEDTEEKLGAMIGQIIRQMGLMEDEEKVKIILESIVVKKDADLCLVTKDKSTGFLQPNNDAMMKLKQAIDDLRPKRIVFDPIANFWGSENALNDMAKAVTKFASWLAHYSEAQVEMINHMGKSSSQSKDQTQFAGRGGTGLPSNSRISRVLHAMTPQEYIDLTGNELGENQSAIQCNINKYTDGSKLYNKPFVILRDGYLFSRVAISEKKSQQLEKELSDTERIFKFVKEERGKDNYPSQKVVIHHFKHVADPIPKSRVESGLQWLMYKGHMGEKLKLIANPDLTVRDQVFVITDEEGREN